MSMVVKPQAAVTVDGDDVGRVVMGQAGHRITFDARDAIRVAQAVLEAGGYFNVKFASGTECGWVDLDDGDAPDEERLPPIIEATRRRYAELDAMLAAQPPVTDRKDRTASERQRRYRERRRDGDQASPCNGEKASRRNAPSVTPEQEEFALAR